MNIKIQNENLISSDRYLNENINDLNEIIKIKNEEQKKILLLSEITKNERRITSSRIDAPYNINDKFRKKISLKHHRNENKEINKPINSFDNKMIITNFKIKNFETEKNSVNFDKLCEIKIDNNSINYIDNNKSQVPDMKIRINEIYGVSPKKESRNIEVKIGGLESNRNNIYNFNTEGNIKKEEKKVKLLNESKGRNQIFNYKNLNSEEREKLRKELEAKIKRQRSEIKRREKESSEKIQKKFLKELVKKKQKEEELKEERIKRKKLREKLDMILKIKEEASKKKILKQQLPPNY